MPSLKSMLSGLKFGDTSRYADPLSGTVLSWEIPKDINKENPAFANCIRHGIMTYKGPNVSSEAEGLGSKNFSHLLPETIINTLTNIPLYIPKDIYADKVLIFLGDRETLVQNKDIIGQDFVRHSKLLPVPLFMSSGETSLTTDDLTVFITPFSGPVQVISPRVIFPVRSYLGKLGKDIGIGFALSLIPGHGSKKNVANRLFRVPAFTYGPSPVKKELESYQFKTSMTGTYPTSLREVIRNTIEETKTELIQIVQHIDKNKNSRPIFYSSLLTQPLRLLAETATDMGYDCGIARVLSPVEDKDMTSFNIMFITLETQHEFVKNVDQIIAEIDSKLDALLKDSEKYFPAILATEAANYPISGSEAERVYANNGIVSLKELAKSVSGISEAVSDARENIDKLGEITEFSTIEDYVRGIPKAAIRTTAKNILKYISNAGIKIAQLVEMFPDQFDSGINDVFLVGELPGSFINTLMHIYGSKFSWTAQSLIGGDALEDSYGFVKKFPKNWDFGPKTYSGDITNEKLRAYYVKKYNPKIFISDIGVDGNNREKLNAPLFSSSADLAIRMLQPGGFCVLKTFGLSTVKMLETVSELMQYFKEVRVVKPTGSSPFNLEVYVIGIHKLEEPKPVDDLEYSALRYAIISCMQKVYVNLNRLDAWTRTFITFGLKINKNSASVKDAEAYIAKILMPR